MKKFLSLLLVIVFAALLVACEKKPSQLSSSFTESTPTEAIDSAVSSIDATAGSDETNTTENSAADDASENSATSDTHTHNFAAASCTTPMTCTICNATEGAALGHNFTAPTCQAPKTCTVCKYTEGSAAAHSYSLGKCSVCGAADPEAATLLLSGSYGTYESLAVDDKEGDLVRTTVKYNGASSVEYYIVQYEETTAAESEIEFNGKHYKQWNSENYATKNISVTENTLFFNFIVEGAPVDFSRTFEYKNGALVTSDGTETLVRIK